MSLDDAIQKVPKPILIVGVLTLALAFFVYNDPLKDECEVQISNFKKNMQGVLYGEKIRKKTQFPQIYYWKDRCRTGNSIGACEDYFSGLRSLEKELKTVNRTCQIKYVQQEEGKSLLKEVSNAVHIMSLVAWGEKPPGGLSERLGWLNETNVRTFCYLKETLKQFVGDEGLLQLREKVYREYPGDWPEKFNVNDLVISNSGPGNKGENSSDIDVSKLVAENRPRAYKTSVNPAGTLTKEQVYERSLFSIRCDLYM